MAHFAEVNDNFEVLRVLVVPDDEEWHGADYLATDLGLGGMWLQTSYNGRIRGQFASMGDIYDPINDVFYTPEGSEG